MANFDLSKLMQDPNFVSGIGLLGAASPRGAPMLQAFQMLQQMEQQKREQAEQQQMMAYRQAQMEQAREHSKLYGAQVEQQRRNLDFQERQAKASARLMESFAKKYGFDLGSEMEAPMAQPSPQQPQPTPSAIPPIGSPGRPMVPYNPAGAQQPTNLGEPNDPNALTREIVATQQNLFQVQDPSSRQQLVDHLAELKSEQERRNKRVLSGSPESQSQQMLSAPNAAKAISGLLSKDPAKQFELLGEALQGEVNDARQRAADLRADRAEGRAERGEVRADVGVGLQIRGDVRAEKGDVRAEKAEDRAAKAAPKGYIRTPGGELVPELTGEESKATAYLKQMEDAQKTFSKLKEKGWNPNSTLNQIGTTLAGGITNPLASEMQQQAKQAQELWAEAYLRFKTGAATNADEIARNIRMFFPQIGDKAANITQKEAARKGVEQAMQVPAGRGVDELKRIGAASGYQPSTTEPRTVVRTGRRKDGTRVIQYSDGSIENVK